MGATTKSLSVSYVAVPFGVNEKAVRLFMRKVLEISESRGNHSMDGTVHIDEFVLCGREQEKVGLSYDSKKKGRVHRTADRRRKGGFTR